MRPAAFSAGVEADRILLFERTERELRRAGFVRGSGPGGARVVATDMLAGSGYEEKITFSGDQLLPSSLDMETAVPSMLSL